MAKDRAGQAPEKLKRAVSFDPEGSKGAVEGNVVLLITEFGAFVDELLEGAGVAAKGQGGERREAVAERGARKRAVGQMPNT